MQGQGKGTNEVVRTALELSVQQGEDSYLGERREGEQAIGR